MTGPIPGRLEELIPPAWAGRRLNRGRYLCRNPIPAMTISYQWLMDYLPVHLEHGRLSDILNSIGLEVEDYEAYEEIKGSLDGLVIGLVVETRRHPAADKLTLTRVDTGLGEPLRIVCGAPNVAEGQKVLVAPVGSTIYPMNGKPLTLGMAKIRGEESHGMICAEDEVGLGDSHEGILVLPDDAPVGIPAAEYFKLYRDHVVSIGLTPNRSDAMSHLGVARDVCAWLSHHEGKRFAFKSPLDGGLPPGDGSLPFSVRIENTEACPRYSGVALTGVRVGESPEWLRRRLKAVGLRPVNNVVDVTNYVMLETGQPLHAFDADRIAGRTVVVRNLPASTPFTTLDEKTRSLHADDLLICDGEGTPLCMAGVFGGSGSGVTSDTVNVFLESACFEPIGIRKSSFRHGLRTDAATRFEKGVDIGGTVDVLKRAASLLCGITGARVASEVLDAYPDPAPPVEVEVSPSHIARIGGKEYGAAIITTILEALGFTLLEENDDRLLVRVPSHKTDVSIPEDIAEEVMRIDGFDNIPIPTRISFSPSTDASRHEESLREKTALTLCGMGFHEMLNNSITDSRHYSEKELGTAVRMMNSLSAELDLMRPSMLETGLQSVARNLNHRNLDLRLFEFGKTYSTSGTGRFEEREHLALFLTGMRESPSWRSKAEAADYFEMKGIVEAVFGMAGLTDIRCEESAHERLDLHLVYTRDGGTLAEMGKVSTSTLDRFDIGQEVWYASIDWGLLTEASSQTSTRFHGLPRFPTVSRDLSIVVDRSVPYASVDNIVRGLKIPRLTGHRLFDVFESEKLGQGLKSMAISFSFRDEGRTLTDEEVDAMMGDIVSALERELKATVRN